jgi:hypothetical protein
MSTRTCFLTSETSTLVQYIGIFYKRIPVKTYIPNPKNCFRCQCFGHTQSRCTSNIICHICRKMHLIILHVPSLHIVSVAPENTPGNPKDCPVYHKVNAISQIWTEKLLFPEACSKYKERQPKLQRTSYMQVTENHLKELKSVSTQTDLEHPGTCPWTPKQINLFYTTPSLPTPQATDIQTSQQDSQEVNPRRHVADNKPPLSILWEVTILPWRGKYRKWRKQYGYHWLHGRIYISKPQTK